MTGLENAYEAVFTAALIFLGFMLLLCLIRAVRGPRVADRLVAVNMMGTMVMVMIAILALLLEEGYLVDICIIYAMISFLAVIVLTKVYMGVYQETRKKDRQRDAAEEDSMDFFQRHKEKHTGDPRSDSSFRNCQIRRFQKNPYNRHYQAVGHKNQDGIQQVPGKANRYRTHHQKAH